MKDIKKINIGLQILRMISSFWVVIVHCYNSFHNKKLHYYLHQKTFHVPNFMLLSFYFYYKLISKRNINKIMQRFQRLLIPYLIWPFFFLLINYAYKFFFNKGIFRSNITLKDYLIQIIIGSHYYSLFWYLTVLLFLTLLFAIIAFIVPNNFLFIIQLFGFFIYRVHRSSIYDYLARKNLAKNSIVLTIRFIPNAVLGLTLGSLNIISSLKRFYLKYMIINLIILYFLVKFNIFYFNDIYLYADIDTLTMGAINCFCFFSLIPFEKVNNNIILSNLKLITNFTGGIYYLHIFIYFFIKKVILFVRNGTFFGTIIIYFCTYLLCFFGTKLFYKTKLIYLFN